MQVGFIILILIALGVLIFLYFHCWKKHKTIKANSVVFVSGAPKTGKSLMGVYLAYNRYKKNRFKWKIKSFFQKITFQNVDEEPLFYSNIPLKCKYKVYALTKDILTRQVRCNKNSVFYCGEWSLIANSRMGQFYGKMNGVDYDKINEELLLFTKLIGHETHGGGFVVIDSQTISDCHYSVKRVLSQYVYIHHNINIPFFKILWVQECAYSEDNSTQQQFTTDVEDNLKWIIIPKRKYYKMYDYCCYSVLTDNLDTNNIEYSIKNRSGLKANDIVSFVDYKTIKKGEKEEDDKKIKKS
jgi:hypothetical protein